VSENEQEIKTRICRVTVDGLAVEGLRVGFTIEKTLKREPNRAELAIYNLARGTREKLHRKRGVPVVVEAGYEDTGYVTIFVGEMREAYSRPEPDGSWLTTLRAGDGDKKKKARQKTSGLRPGVSFQRVVSDLAKSLGVGVGNVGRVLAQGNLTADGIGAAFASGFNGAGETAKQFDQVIAAAGHEWSVQDGQIQLLEAGKTLGVIATVLTPTSGLEGSAEIDEKGVMSCRARIVPGLVPGYPLQVESATVNEVAEFERTGQVQTGVWRIEKVRYVGDTHGKDWNAEIDAIEVSG
jgi:hypothetical protein